MGKYEDLTRAREIVGIEESETLKKIKDKFKKINKKISSGCLQRKY